MSSRARMLAACRRELLDAPPLWVMRQAGRYLPEYRELREGKSFLELVRAPELAAELTCQPLRRYELDAAVIFSDILVPAAALGQHVDFQAGEGPSLAPAIRSRAEVGALRDFDAEQDTGFVGEAIARVRRELGDDKAIIGFCGGPWTTASYMIEGGSSRDHAHAKQMLWAEPELFESLLRKLVDNLLPYLAMQVAAGADLVQVFESWGGALDADTYARAVLPHLARLIAGARELRVPVIVYVNGGAHLLETLASARPDVIGLDWRIAPAEAIARIGDRVALQGNLDPCVLLAPEAVEREAERVLERFRGQRGHVYNLGSGILPQTPVESMSALVTSVRRARAEARR